MKMMDQSAAFPRKVNFDQYLPLVEAALNAAKGVDGLPRVVIEGYENSKLAVRAANAIRNHVKQNGPELRVSCPENGKSVYVVKGKPRARRPNAPKQTVSSADNGTEA
jgi:hypothetical protein